MSFYKVLSAGMKVGLVIAALSSPALAQTHGNGRDDDHSSWNGDRGDRGDRGGFWDWLFDWLRNRGGHGNGNGNGNGGGGGGGHSVPEFDPAAGGAMGALLAGGALTLARRRRSK